MRFHVYLAKIARYAPLFALVAVAVKHPLWNLW